MLILSKKHSLLHQSKCIHKQDGMKDSENGIYVLHNNTIHFHSNEQRFPDHLHFTAVDTIESEQHQLKIKTPKRDGGLLKGEQGD